MRRHPFRFRVAVAAIAAVLATVLPGPSVADADDGKPAVLLVHAFNASNRDHVRGYLQASGAFAKVDAFNAATLTPTASDLAGYDAVLVANQFTFGNVALLGNVLADFVDGGGHVVVALQAIDCFGGNAEPAGRFRTGGYLPVRALEGCTPRNGAGNTLVRSQPAHPLLAGVGSFDGGSQAQRFEVELQGTSLQVARWSDGLPLVARNRTRDAIGGVVAINVRALNTEAGGGSVNSWDPAVSDGIDLFVNALLDGRPAPVGPAGFPDVAPGAFYSGAVDWAGSTGVTTGYGDTGQFRPDEVVDRGQMATFLWRTMDRLAGYPASGFPDVPPGVFYEPGVRWAKATGVTTGFGATGTYAPAEVVTRGQMVTFLHRIAGTPGPHGPHGFPDVAPGAFYEAAVRWAKATGVTTGFGATGEFRPDEPVTRGQMVTFLDRLARTPGAWGTTVQLSTTLRF